MSFELGRLVCAIIPYGQPEDVIRDFKDTNSIIGYDQYRRMKSVLSNIKIELFDNSQHYNENDVLIVMSTIWTVPVEIFDKFKVVVYFYDDIEIFKAQTEKYSNHMKYVDLVLHPEPDVASSLQNFWKIPTIYMPWSSASLPAFKPKKPDVTKIFLDMDDRPFAAKSIEYGASFVSSLRDYDVDIHVPSSVIKLFPEELKGCVNVVPRMPHDEFLEFMSGMTWYASGIFSSYEYIVMESALLGCGLISLFNCVRKFHRNRECVVDYNGVDAIGDKLIKADCKGKIDQIIASSRALYPYDAVSQIPAILKEIFHD